MDNQGLLDFVDDLISKGISLAIIGGHAVNFHGYLRTTEDIDLVIKCSRNRQDFRVRKFNLEEPKFLANSATWNPLTLQLARVLGWEKIRFG